MDLLKKAEALNQKFDMASGVDKSEVFGWYTQAKKLLLINSLKENDGLKFLLDNFTMEVKQINDKLLDNNSLKLPDYERDLLIIEKRCYKKFLDLFEHNDKSIQLLEKKIDEEL